VQGNTIDNAAVLQLQMTKGQNQFLSTLAKDGEAQFLTALKPCGILLPHVHQRANEFYSVIFGARPRLPRRRRRCLHLPALPAAPPAPTARHEPLADRAPSRAGQMSAGISQENGNAQDITLEINPGETFVVPQGLLHYNHNQECVPNVFFQSFDSADPGALNVIGALAAFNDAGGDGAAAMLASGADSIRASPQGAFALDQQCLKRCGFPETGAPGDGLKDLPAPFRPIFGLH